MSGATPFVRPPWAWPLSVWSVLVEGPTVEPLTLDEAKLRAGLDWTPGDPRDPLLEDFIRAARAQVEQDTGLALLTQTRDVYVLVPAAALPSQTQPTQSITPLLPTRATVARPWPYQPGRLAVFDPAWDAPASYRVVAGWPNPAALRAEAPTLLHAVGLLVAHYATLGRDLARTEPTSPVVHGYEDAIAAHRLIWVP